MSEKLIEVLVADLNSSAVSAVEIQRISHWILTVYGIAGCLVAVTSGAGSKYAGEDTARYR